MKKYSEKCAAISRHQPPTHNRWRLFLYLCIVIQKALENHFPSWRKIFLQLGK